VKLIERPNWTNNNVELVPTDHREGGRRSVAEIYLRQELIGSLSPGIVSIPDNEARQEEFSFVSMRVAYLIECEYYYKRWEIENIRPI
jgi:hypothetical protein